MTFAIVGGLAGMAAGAAGIGGLTAVSGGLLGAAIGSSVGGAKAANRAADVQAQAAQQAGDVQRQIFERQVELQEPWRQAGINALGKLGTGFTGQVDLKQDPGYAFRLSEGMKALEHSAAARGNLLSGTGIKGALRFGQDYASQEYQNAYNRALTQYNTTAALAGVGQTATNQLSGAAGQYGQNAAEAIQNAAAARASGYVGGANALTSALGTGLNYLQGQNYLAALQNRPNVTIQPVNAYPSFVAPPMQG